MDGQPIAESGFLGPNTDRASPSESARLAKSIAEGDLGAEQEFVIRYTRPVRIMLLSRVRDADLASDLGQDVLIEAICALRRGQLQDPEKLTAFVVGIARNRANAHFRTNRRAVLEELPENLPDLSPGFEIAAEHEQEGRALQAIESLEPTDRMILQMTLVEGLKPGVIAEKLRMNPDLVRQRKLRATRRVIELVRNQSQNRGSNHFAAGRAK
jgi:RNA polymerase sigma-70 factor (ECF subfamily)